MWKSGLALVAGLVTGQLFAAPQIELEANGRKYQGQNVGHNHASCRLLATDGTLHTISLAEVKDYRQIAGEFSPLSVMQMQQRLQKLTGLNLEVASRGQFVVMAPKGRAQGYADLCDQTSRDFLQYLKVRKFELTPITLPLVVVVYGTAEEFAKQCELDGVKSVPGLTGYYHQQSNRVTMFDQADALNAPVNAKPDAQIRQVSTRTNRSESDRVADARVQETLVHEAIHQLAFNSGLHQRLGANPRWVIEGLAMQFELGDAGRVKTRTSANVNFNRLKNFEEYRKTTWKAGNLFRLIASDDVFKTTRPVDVYSEAWMLTNFLMETRPRKYSDYLKTLAGKDPLNPETPRERLDDFTAIFGQDLAWLEVEYLRYADQVSVEMSKQATSGRSR